MRGMGDREWGASLAEGLEAPVADVLMLSVPLAFVSLAAPWTVSSAACSGPAWRHLPPSSRMVRLLAGLGPGSRPPLLPASELPRVPPGGLPAAGREELWHRQGCSSRTPTENLNRVL